MVGALLALEATELLLRTVSVEASARLHWLAVLYPAIPLGLSMVLPGFLSARLGRPGRLLLACGLGLDAVLMLRFRGLWTWDGSFDHYWLSPHPWMIALVIGSIAGYILGGLRHASRAVGPVGFALMMVATIGLAFFNWVLARIWAGQIDSFFPPTRFFAMTGIVLALGVLWYAHTLETRDFAA